MSKTYTFEEICQNRVRIKKLGEKTFIEIYDFCRNFGEIIFFDVLVCARPFVYVSFLHREDADAAMTKINEESSMVAILFIDQSSNTYSNEFFVLDISKLEEFESIRMLRKVTTIFFLL